MTRIHDGRNYRRARRCDCAKVPYRDEGAALAAADRLGAEFDTAFRAYMCPGTQVWHLATRGFHPRALKSDARVMAWHVSARGAVDRQWLLEQFGVGPDARAQPGAENNKARKLAKILRTFAELGLVELDVPRPGYVTVLDRAGLQRVMAVGLQEYEASGRGSAPEGS